MIKYFFILIFLGGCTAVSSLQKTNILAVQHLLELGNFEEAKNVVEEMIADPEMSQWSRTWYLRGIVSHNAYRVGVEKNNRKLMELYPDQLYVAFASFERARELDNRDRINKRLAPRYIQLVNDIQRIGERHYAAGRFAEAQKAFEQAIAISQSPVLAAEPSNDLIYNSALAAYRSKDQKRAIEQLTLLHKLQYSTNATHLLSNIHLKNGDTLDAKRVLSEAIQKFEYNEDLVLLQVDLLYESNSIQEALLLLENASAIHPDNYKFLYAKGLVFQKSEQYQLAIETYQRALKIEPDEPILYLNIATSYFNIGVEIEEDARLITDHRRTREEKARSDAAFASALEWLDKLGERGSENQTVNLKKQQLYRAMGVNIPGRDSL